MKNREWWVIERFDEGTQEWENVQGRYAYRADTSVMHTFISAVALYMVGWGSGKCRFVNKKTGRIISANDLLCVRIRQS